MPVPPGNAIGIVMSNTKRKAYVVEPDGYITLDIDLGGPEPHKSMRDHVGLDAGDTYEFAHVTYAGCVSSILKVGALASVNVC